MPEFPTESQALGNLKGRVEQRWQQAESSVGRGTQSHTGFFSNAFTAWAWAQELGSTIQAVRSVPGTPRHGTTCLLPNHPNHSPGGSTGQQPLPVGILDTANLTERTGERHGTATARHCLASPGQGALAWASWLSAAAAPDPCFTQLPSLHANLPQTTGKSHLFPLQNFQQYHQVQVNS